MTFARCLILAASIVLLCNGLAHLLGYTHVIAVLTRNGVNPGIVSAIQAIWLIYTLHLVLLSVAIVWISRLPGTRSLLLFLALFSVSDAVLMFGFIGPFIGLYAVSVAALLLLVGAWLLPRSETPAAK